MGIADSTSTNRSNRIICLPFSQDNYEDIIQNPNDFRKCIDQQIDLFPELFPPEITDGYRMKDKYSSKKLPVTIRRIEVRGTPYTIRPSFVMPRLV